MAKINVTGTDITIIRIEDADCISLIDMNGSVNAGDGAADLKAWKLKIEQSRHK